MVYREAVKVVSNHGVPTFHNVTQATRDVAARSGIQNGIVSIYSHHTTCCVITQECAFDMSMTGLETLQLDFVEVFESIKEKYNGQPVDIHTSKADKAQLFDFLDKVLPDNDADRIYPGDVKKLIQWYNILVQAGYTDFLETDEEEEATAEAAPAE